MPLYVPTLHACLGAVGLFLTSLMLLGLGSAAIDKDMQSETKLIAGWGVLCIALTFCAVFIPSDLRIPLLGAAVLGTIGLIGSRRQTSSLSSAEWRRGAGRLLLVTLPLWVIMLPLRPAEIDTWWNLLPNAAYLFDYGRLPVQGGPESYSFLPAAPYNTQFIAFSGSVMSGSFAEGALGLFNVLLLCTASLLVARVAAHGNHHDLSGPVPWWACALGCLIVVPLNPAFVPRVFLSPYGETGLAVTTLFAVWLATDLLDGFARGVRPRAAIPLALTLAAMVNVKQAGIGLVLPIGVAMTAMAITDPRIRSVRAVLTGAACLLPALTLYSIWRVFVQTSFPTGELTVMAVSDWNWRLLPRILAAVLKAIFQKAPYFLCLFSILMLAARQLLMRVWDRQTLLLGMTAGVTLLFILFLLFTYVAHFDPTSAADAHSFFRYTMQLSLIAMMTLTCMARPWLAARLSLLSGVSQRRVGFVAVALTLGLPLALITQLRFDLDAPQRVIWALGRGIAAYMREPRIALLLPGDVDDGVGSMLRGVMSFTPPRHRFLNFAIRLQADPAALTAVVADGYGQVFISCSSAEIASVPGLADIPAGVAALLRHSQAGWEIVKLWRYPASLATKRFAAQIERAPLCSGPIRNVTPAISWHRPV